jgi:hypothetical protein
MVVIVSKQCLLLGGRTTLHYRGEICQFGSETDVLNFNKFNFFKKNQQMFAFFLLCS